MIVVWGALIVLLPILLFKAIVWYEEHKSVRPIKFSYNSKVASAIALLMKADGKAMRDELGVVKDYLRMHYSEEAALQMLKELRVQLSKDYSDPEEARRLFREIGEQLAYGERLFLYSLLSKLSVVDKFATSEEKKILELYALYAKIKTLDVELFREFNFGKYAKRGVTTSTIDWAFKTLDLPRPMWPAISVSLEMVERAYQSLCDQYHPDHLLEAPMEEKVSGLSKLLVVNEAYRTLVNNASIWESKKKSRVYNGPNRYYKDTNNQRDKEVRDIEWALGILGLPVDPTDDQIIKAFQQAMRRYPPTKNESPNDRKMRNQIEKAYKILMKK